MTINHRRLLTVCAGMVLASMLTSAQAQDEPLGEAMEVALGDTE